MQNIELKVNWLVDSRADHYEEKWLDVYYIPSTKKPEAYEIKQYLLDNEPITLKELLEYNPMLEKMIDYEIEHQIINYEDTYVNYEK